MGKSTISMGHGFNSYVTNSPPFSWILGWVGIGTAAPGSRWKKCPSYVIKLVVASFAAASAFLWLWSYGSIPINTIFRGINIHKSQLFWRELQGDRVLTHPLMTLSLLWSSFFFLSLLWLFPALFHLSMLSEVWLLNFLRWNESSHKSRYPKLHEPLLLEITFF